MTETRVLAEICFGSRWARCGNTLAAGSAFVDGKLMTAGLLARSFDSAGGALESMPSRCNGFFAVVSVSESTIFAAVDRVRSIPVFYCIDNGKVLLSDDPHLIRERAGIENKDGPAEKELLLTRYVTGPDTLYTQIKQLQAGEYLFIDRYVAIEKQRAAKRYYIFTHTDLNGGSGRKLDRAEKEREFRELTERNIGELDKAFCRLAEYAAGRPIVVPLSGAGTVAIEAVGPNGLTYREERAVVPGTDEILTIDLEAEAAKQAARQRAAQEEQSQHDFILFVVIAMIVSLIAAMLSVLFGGPRSK